LSVFCFLEKGFGFGSTFIASLTKSCIASGFSNLFKHLLQKGTARALPTLFIAQQRQKASEANTSSKLKTSHRSHFKHASTISQWHQIRYHRIKVFTD
jgi:hypothetical protein